MTNKERDLYLQECRRIDSIWNQLLELAQRVIADTEAVFVGQLFFGMSAKEINEYIEDCFVEDDEVFFDDPLEELRPCE